MRRKRGKPSSAFIGPLALLTLVFGRKKKRSKWDNMVIVAVLCLAVGMSLAGCGGKNGDGTPTLPPAQAYKVIFTPTATTIFANNTPVATYPPIKSPDGGTCTITITPNMEDLGGGWKITHYNYAMENDDAAFPKDYVTVGGLGTRQFRRQFIYNVNKGIPLQGTGLAEDGFTYITIDWEKTNNAHPHTPDWWDTTDPTTWFFKIGKGGRFAEGNAWSSIAVSQAELDRDGGLRNGDTVRIDGYCQTFIVTDTGSFTDAKHIDIFIGATTYAEAIKLGTKSDVRVWRVGKKAHL